MVEATPEGKKVEAKQKGKAVESSKTTETRRWTGTPFDPPGLSQGLERRFQKLKSKLSSGVKALTYLNQPCCNGGSSSSSKKVHWADAAGLALTRVTIFGKDDSFLPTVHRTATKSIETDIYKAEDRPWKATQSSSKRTPAQSSSKRTPAPLDKKSFKEALLSTPPPPPPPTPAPPRSPPLGPARRSSFSFKGKCFRCLGRDHRAANCRDPIKCTTCLKSGHKARDCMDRLPLNVYRAMRARPAYLSAFVPLSEDFSARQHRRRNAILVDVVPPANLGHFPQETIANGLANRFGGYPTDFLVARYRERDYVIFLPEWVQAESLIRREIISLGEFRLQCYGWYPYRGARRFLPSYKAWIRLVSLPYECWSSRTVGAIVGGFGRFLRADDFTTRMADLSGYRCLVAVNYLSDIPENVEINFGDISISVLIQLERWARDADVGRGNPPPPNERSGNHDPEARSFEVDRRNPADSNGRRSSDAADSNSNNSWNSSEIRDRRRDLPPAIRTTNLAPPPPPFSMRLDMAAPPRPQAPGLSRPAPLSPVGEVPAGRPQDDGARTCTTPNLSLVSPVGEVPAGRPHADGARTCTTPNLSLVSQSGISVFVKSAQKEGVGTRWSGPLLPASAVFGPLAPCPNVALTAPLLEPRALIAFSRDLCTPVGDRNEKVEKLKISYLHWYFNYASFNDACSISSLGPMSFVSMALNALNVGINPTGRLQTFSLHVPGSGHFILDSNLPPPCTCSRARPLLTGPRGPLGMDPNCHLQGCWSTQPWTSTTALLFSPIGLNPLIFHFKTMAPSSLLGSALGSAIKQRRMS